MGTYIVAGLEIAYGPGTDTTLDWLAFEVPHLKGGGVSKVWFSKRNRIFHDPEDALEHWLDSEWVRTRLAENPENRAPFFSDKPLTTVDES